jgi:transcriptional regulator with XRE-family HTH domain
MYSQTELASRLGISQPLLSNYENGKRPPPRMVKKIDALYEKAFGQKYQSSATARPNTAFAVWMREERAKRNLTQHDLAEKAGISTIAISYIETGKVLAPRQPTIDAIRKALQQTERVPPEEIYDQPKSGSLNMEVPSSRTDLSSLVTIDVKNRTIQTLIDEVKTGKYYLPSFQRQYVWDEEDIKELVASVIDSHPIGTIILWKPSTMTPEKIDPFSLPLIGDGAQRRGGEINYIIDGQQRLTSLLLMFNHWKISRGGETISRDPISYNLSTSKFYKGIARGTDLSELISAFCLQDVDALTRLAQRIPRDRLDIVKEKIRKILQYPIPMYVMETSQENQETFQSMADAFVKVNKNGVRIGNLELMLSFLAGSISGELKQKISRMYDSANKDFGIDLQPVIRFSFSRFGLKQTQVSKADQFKSNLDKILALSPGERTQRFDRIESALSLTINLLRTKFGIQSSSILPSQTVLVPIASYFYRKDISEITQLTRADTDSILDWFVLASFNGYYSSRTDTKLDRDLAVIEEGGDSFPYRTLLENMKGRKISKADVEEGLNQNVLRTQGKAFIFLEYILLVENDAEDWTGVRVKEKHLNELDRHHIFPQEYLQQNLALDDPEQGPIKISNLGNITWINKSVNEEIGDEPPSSYLQRYGGSLESHFIPTDKNLWTIDQYETFLEYRIKRIFASLKQHFNSIAD